LSSATSSANPNAGKGPNIGHNTPTNVFAWTGEPINETHKATAIASFFTLYIPDGLQQRPGHRQPSIAGI